MIIIADEMENAMDYDSVEFFLELGSILDCIFTDTVDADEQVTGESVPFAIVEGDDVSEIVMLEVLLIYIEDVVVGTEDYRYVTDTADLAFSNKTKPTVIQGFALENEICVLEIVRNHAKIFRKSTILYKKFEIKIIISNFNGQSGI